MLAKTDRARRAERMVFMAVLPVERVISCCKSLQVDSNGGRSLQDDFDGGGSVALAVHLLVERPGIEGCAGRSRDARQDRQCNEGGYDGLHGNLPCFPI